MPARIPASSASVIAISRRLHRTAHLQIPAVTHSSLQTRPSQIEVQPFSHSTRLTHPRKDSEDKDSINTETTEYSKSATDDEAARQTDIAFNPNVAHPQEQKDLAGKNQRVNTIAERNAAY